jgi:hypothetical protein
MDRGGEESRETWAWHRRRGNGWARHCAVRRSPRPVRNAIPAGLVRATWDPTVLRDVLAAVQEELGLPNAAELDVDLHSLLVYEPGQFFLRHQDTEKTDEMIGTLVVTLPSAYAGGELMIGKGEDWKAYRRSRDSLSLVAFYADCQHEVLKVRSGYRITLTYNLMLRGDTYPAGKATPEPLLSWLTCFASTSARPRRTPGASAGPTRRAGSCTCSPTSTRPAH